MRPRPAVPALLRLLPLALLAWAANPARADGGPLGSACYACALWMPFGINLGAGPRWQGGTRRTELRLGGEVSVIDLRGMRRREGWFLGAYLDTLYDPRAHRGRTSLGPEAIYYRHRFDYALGVDLGAVAEWDADAVRWGARLRVFLPLAFLTPYVGYTRLFTPEAAGAIEAGLLLKFPAVLAK
jgi:hypothetical protein